MWAGLTDKVQNGAWRVVYRVQSEVRMFALKTVGVGFERHGPLGGRWFQMLWFGQSPITQFKFLTSNLKPSRCTTPDVNKRKHGWPVDVSMASVQTVDHIHMAAVFLWHQGWRLKCRKRALFQFASSPLPDYQQLKRQWTVQTGWTSGHIWS